MTSADARAAPGSGWRRAALAAYVVLTIFAHPQRIGGIVIDGGLVLGPVSVAALLVGIAGGTPRRAARDAFFAAWLAHAGILHWIWIVTVRYGGATDALGVLAVLALATYPAAATAGVAAAVRWLAARDAAGPIVVAALFVLGDHLQSFVASGFPWSLLGYTQLEDPGLLPWARVGGVYAVGFGAALGGALVAAAVVAVSRGRPLGARVRRGAVVWVALHAVGLGLGATAGAPSGPVVRVAALQGSFEQGLKWSRERYSRTLEVYETLTRRAAAEGATLIAWPETAVPGPIELDPEAAGRVDDLARRTGATLVVGAVGIRPTPDGRAVAAWYDSAFLVEPDGRWAGRYDKSHLVPFGEYVPFRAVLGRLVGAIARGAAPLDVSAGREPVALSVRLETAAAGAASSVRVGVPICYELLFPDRVRRFVDDGAQVLVAITNDAWYGRTGAPHQFLAITAMRAAETGVALVRAANTGVSGLIDETGRVQAQSGLFERGYVIGDVRLAGTTAPTFYARHGDRFVQACWAGAAWVVVRALRRRRDDGTQVDSGSGVAPRPAA